MPEIEKSLRYRVNVSTSIKGIKTWDCTVELSQAQDVMLFNEGVKSMLDALELSDELVRQLELRYPVLKEAQNDKTEK